MSYTVRFIVGESKDITMAGVTEEGFKKLQEKFGDDTDGMKEYLMTAVRDWDYEDDPEGVIVAGIDRATFTNEYGLDGLNLVEVTDEVGDTVFTMDSDNYGTIDIEKDKRDLMRSFFEECKEKNVKYVFCQYYLNGEVDAETELECDDFDPDKLQLIGSEVYEETDIFNEDGICIYPYGFWYDGEKYFFDDVDYGASDSYLDVFMLDEEGQPTCIKDQDDDEYQKMEFDEFMDIL